MCFNLGDTNDLTVDRNWEVYERVSGRGCPGGIIGNFGNFGAGLNNGITNGLNNGLTNGGSREGGGKKLV